MEFPTQITDQFDNAAKTVVDTNERVIDTVVSANRRFVDNAVETVDRLPSVELPLADRLPTPASFNRDMTKRVVDMLPRFVQSVPLLEHDDDPRDDLEERLAPISSERFERCLPRFVHPSAQVVLALFFLGRLPNPPLHGRIADEHERPWLTVGSRRRGRGSFHGQLDQPSGYRTVREVPHTPSCRVFGEDRLASRLGIVHLERPVAHRFWGWHPPNLLVGVDTDDGAIVASDHDE